MDSTRTIVDNFMPKWNEQYIWEVFDPYTVITVGVFDNGHIHGGARGTEDARIGKVRIRFLHLKLIGSMLGFFKQKSIAQRDP